MSHSSDFARLPAALSCLFLFAACGDDDHAHEGHDETSNGDGDGDTGDGDGDTGDGDGDSGDGDGDGDTGDGDGDGDGPDLGATPNVLCEATLTNLAMIVAENQSGTPDPLAIEAAYMGTGLLEFVQLSGAVTGRIDAGVLIDPLNVDALREAMYTLAGQEPLRAALRARGLARARAFFWRHVAEATVAVYREALGPLRMGD